MTILPTASLIALLTKAVKIVETTALKRTNQRHVLHYLLKGLGDLPTPLIERINHYLKAPTAEQYPHTDAHMRLIIGLNHKLKPPIQTTQLIQLRKKFATEMVAIQSPSVWQQINTDNNAKNTNHNDKENGSAVSWQDKVIANADGGDMVIRCYQAESNTIQNPERNGDNPEKNCDNVVMLFFHGGGFCVGDVNTDHEFCHVVCAQTSWAVVSVDYRLAPEYPAPTAIKDCLEAYTWL